MKSIKQSDDPSIIFKNVIDSPFKSWLDWELYINREVHELLWIYEGLKKSIPKGAKNKLENIISGSDFAYSDVNKNSRDTQFELRIASYFLKADFSVDLDTDTDIVASSDKHVFFIECKRVSGLNSLQKRIEEAFKQLKNRMPETLDGKNCHGIIVIDVTAVAYSHNGITMGVTFEHARNAIQKKLLLISNTLFLDRVLRKKSNVLELWLQIHMPSVTIIPRTISTRISSYFIPNIHMGRKRHSAWLELDLKRQTVVEQENLRVEKVPLEQRTKIKIPAGALFWVDTEKINEYIQDGLPAECDYSIPLIKATISNKEFIFGYFDLMLIDSNLDRREFTNSCLEVHQIGIILASHMLLIRDPYGEYYEF